ncbi:MAG: hypothetical protein IVW57_06820 [Ktedonobacterales bacterium]|nr:hypothetical protein [Ktedonobacterales bacterium]
MRLLNAWFSMLSVVALAFGNGIYILTVARCGGLGCLANAAGALLFIGAGVVLGLVPWLFSLFRWLTGGPGGGVPAALPFSPLLPAAVFLAETATPLRPYFASHFTLLFGSLLAALLLTPYLTLVYNIDTLYANRSTARG